MICGFGAGRLGPAKHWSRILADQFPGRLPADPEPALRVGRIGEGPESNQASIRFGARLTMESR
jgi:hypothetical protein